jgi:UDP-2-acetamido-2,6-beta-L-arabino-hexul-4-ose reductase
MVYENNMKRIGITGRAGFIGTHLYNTLSLGKDKYQLVPFQDSYFDSEQILDAFVRQCDVVVHLAAMNRHNDPQVIYKTNIELVTKLINALERTNSKPYVIMSSSLQEESNNLYGKSKKEGRLLLTEWSEKNHAKFTGLIIPNVFGPFGVPFYNSVISTFSYQLANGLEPKIDIDAELKLIYINELVKEVLVLIDKSQDQSNIPNLLKIDYTAKKKVSDLLSQLSIYSKDYQGNNIIPDLRDPFDIALFNTYRAYIPLAGFPVQYKKHTDTRGDFVEIMKLNTSGQVSYSTTKPGITRGNHFHIRKVERFAVIKGNAIIKLRRTGTDQIHEFFINGENPGFIDMPVWFTHNITNIGNDELITLFWINEQFDSQDPDTYYENV